MTCPVRVFMTCPPVTMQIQHKDGEKDVAMRQLLYSMLVTEGDQTAQKVRCALCYVLVHLTFKLSIMHPVYLEHFHVLYTVSRLAVCCDDCIPPLTCMVLHLSRL